MPITRSKAKLIKLLEEEVILILASLKDIEYTQD